jgi:hypothetical protein
LQVRDKELKGLLGDARFYSITYRLFKLPEAIETLCEDYGQACKYKVWQRQQQGQRRFPSPRFLPCWPGSAADSDLSLCWQTGRGLCDWRGPGG